MTVPSDYDADPERYRLGMRNTRAHSAASLYARVALLLRELEAAVVLDVGCADGALREAIAAPGPQLVGLDASAVLSRAHPAPMVRADAARLPFLSSTFDAVTALNLLYHLPDPMPALRESHRVLRAGGHLVAATIARNDSPEFDRYWTRPTTSFDAEDAPELVERVFDSVATRPWDAPLVTLPGPEAIREYLVGRQAPPEIADAAAREMSVPLRVTKRGTLIIATRR